MKNIKIKYTLTQSLFWMLMACLTSYLNVILTGRDINVAKIGIIAAIGNIIAAFLGPFISQACEKSMHRTEREYMLFLILVSIFALILSLIIRSPITIVLVLILIPNIITLALQPLLNSLGMNYVQLVGLDFSRSRGIGALSYAICSLFLGRLSVNNSDMPIIFSIFIFGALFFVMLSQPTIEKKTILQSPSGEYTNETSFTKFEVWASLFGVVMLFIFYQINHSYMLQIMQNLGGNSAHMGYAFSIAAFSETVVMFLIARILTKFPLVKVFKFSAAMFILKGILTYLSPSVEILLFIQFTQLFGFGIFTPSSVYLFNKKFPISMRIRAQGYLTSAIMIGGVFGSLIGGILVENFGIQPTLLVSIMFATLGTLSIFTIKDRS